MPGRDQLIAGAVDASHDIPGLWIRILLDQQQVTSGEWTTRLLQATAGLQAPEVYHGEAKAPDQGLDSALRGGGGA